MTFLFLLIYEPQFGEAVGHGGRRRRGGGKSGTQAWDAEGVYVFITVHSMRL